MEVVGSLYFNPNTGRMVFSGAVAREERRARKTARRRSSATRTRATAARAATPAASSTPQYGPTPQRVRAESREQRTGQVISPAARRTYTNLVAQEQFQEFRRANADYRSSRPTPRDDDDQREAGLDRLRTMGLTGGGDQPLGFLGNFGRDALDIVTGVPSGIVLGTKAASYPVLKAAGLGDETERELGAAGRAIKEDCAYRYGPLFSGDFGTFAERSKEHPGLLALDVAGVWSAAGAGVRIGAGTAARATGSTGRVARVGEKSILPAGRSAAPGGRISTGARYRPPRERTMRQGENTDYGADGPLTATVSTPRRPYSPNPLTRGLIQKPVEKLDFGGFIERRMGQRRFDSQARSAAADLRHEAELEKGRRVRAGTAELRSASRELFKEVGKEQGRGAFYLHLNDLLNVPGKTRTAARADAVNFMESNLRATVEAKGIKGSGAKRSREALENVPENLLNLETAPPALRRMVEAGRAVSREATAMRVEAGTITPETAAAVGPRKAQMIQADVRWDPSRVKQTPEVAEARARFNAALYARSAGPRLTPLAASRRSYSAGRTAGRGQRNVELARPIPWAPRRQPAQPSPWEPGAFPVGPGNARPRGISSSQANAYRQVLRGQGRQYQTRIDLKASQGLQRNVREARTNLSRVEARNRGDWTPPSRTDVGTQGVYFPDRPASRLAGRASTDSPAGAFARMTQDRVRESHGTLFGMGNVNLSERVVMQALERSLVDELHPQFMRQMIDAFAFKTDDGKVASADRAIQAMRSDPDHVVLASRASVEDAMRLSRSTREGEMPGDPFTEVEVLEGPAGVRAAELFDEGRRSELIAMPKAAVEAVRRGWGPGRQLPFYDTPLQLWRRGILAFAPRWYLNSLFGNTLQYGLLTGGDVRSILQARRTRVGGVAPERLNESGVIADARLVEPASSRGGRMRQGFIAASDKGMDFNHKLEAIMRRAAYINRAKRGLKGEGVSLRGLKDEDLIRLIDEAPLELKTQALRETELFMGDYVRLSPFERDWLRRLLPWYSWMRVIGRFMATVPIQHPKRIAVLAAVSRASTAAINPDDYMLPVYDRGRVNLPGGLAWRSFAANPFATHAELASNVASGNPAAIFGGLARDITPIGGQQLAQYLSGRNTFGRPFSAPPGYGGASQAFGYAPVEVNPATGLSEESPVAPPWHELALQTVPLVPSLVRGFAAGGRTPYDTATTWDLVTRSRPDWQLFRPAPEGPRSSEPLVPRAGPVPIPLNPALSVVGLNVHRRNRDAERQRYLDQLERLEEARRQTARRIARVANTR